MPREPEGVDIDLAEVGVHAEEPLGRRSLYVDDTRRRRQRRWGRRLLMVLLAPIILSVGFLGYLDFRIHRVDVVGDYTGRPADSPGSNWLIVGSDSRDGLSKRQQKALHTGGDVGKRTDSMMLLHTGDHGSTLVSLPRDSYLPIPGHGPDKLNDAYALGGPKLLSRTVERSTGLRIDHYAEIGFGGFVGMVDAVGGVRICVTAPIHDKKAGLDLRSGCQNLRGAQALGYVRARHAFHGGDLDRVKHQREFLAALVHKASSSTVLTDPLRIVPFALHGADNITVDRGDHLWQLATLARAMRELTNGNGTTTTVPVSGTTPDRRFVKWDATQASALFTALRQDRPIPR